MNQSSFQGTIPCHKKDPFSSLKDIPLHKRSTSNQSLNLDSLVLLVLVVLSVFTFPSVSFEG